MELMLVNDLENLKKIYKKKDSHPAINAKASTTTSGTTWDMDPSLISIHVQSENIKILFSLRQIRSSFCVTVQSHADL